jgi:hypothetical protein
MILQEVVTYIIVAFAVGYTIYQFIKVFIPSKTGTTGCSGCSGECSVHDLKKHNN